jgi:hypothetical protein
VTSETDAARLWGGLILRRGVVDRLRDVFPTFVAAVQALSSREGIDATVFPAALLLADPESRKRLWRKLAFLPDEVRSCAVAVLERWALTGDTTDPTLPVPFPKGTGPDYAERRGAANAIGSPLDQWAVEALGRRAEARARKKLEPEVTAHRKQRKAQQDAGRETARRRHAGRPAEWERWREEARRIASECRPGSLSGLAAEVKRRLDLPDHVKTVAKRIREAER